MSLAQRIIAALLVGAVLLCMALPGVALFFAGKWPLLITWGTCCVVIIGVMVIPTIHTMSRGKMMIRSCWGNVYGPLYEPTLEHRNGMLNSGLVVPFPPGMVKVYKLPTGLIEIPILSTSSNVKDGDDMTPVSVFMHIQVQIAKDEVEVKKLIDVVLGITGHYDFTDEIQIEYFASRDDDVDQTPKVESRPSSCIVNYLLGLFQSAVDEAISAALKGFTLAEARAAHKPMEDAILARLNLDGTVWAENKLGLVFPKLDFVFLGVVPSKAVQVALSAGMLAKLEARGVIETAKGIKEAWEKKAAAFVDPNALVVAQTEVAMQIAQNSGTILTTGPMDMAGNMLVANRATKAPTPPPATPTP